MKIYFGHARITDNAINELYSAVKKSQINGLHEVVLPKDRDSSFDSKEFLKSCDLMFAEVSIPSTGLGMEIGWAVLYGIKIYCVSRKGSKISNSLKFITSNFFEYSTYEELVEYIEKVVNEIKK
mgnify:FL=1